MMNTKKRHILPLTALLLVSVCGSNLTVWATESETAAYAQSDENEVMTASQLLIDGGLVTLPTTWEEAAEQIFQLLGLSGGKTMTPNDASSSESTSDANISMDGVSSNDVAVQTEQTGQTYLDTLLSLGVLDETLSDKKADAEISADEYAQLLDQLFPIVIQTQEDINQQETANTALSSSGRSQSAWDDTVVSGENEDLTIGDIEVQHLLIGAMQTLSLENADIESIAMVKNGYLTLSDSQADALYVNTSEVEVIHISVDTNSTISTMVINQAGEVVIDGDGSVDTLVVTGSVVSLTVQTDGCSVINQTGEELSYTDADGSNITVQSSKAEADSTGETGSGSSSEKSSGSSLTKGSHSSHGSSRSSTSSGSSSSNRSGSSSHFSGHAPSGSTHRPSTSSSGSHSSSTGKSSSDSSSKKKSSSSKSSTDTASSETDSTTSKSKSSSAKKGSSTDSTVETESTSETSTETSATEASETETSSSNSAEITDETGIAEAELKTETEIESEMTTEPETESETVPESETESETTTETSINVDSTDTTAESSSETSQEEATETDTTETSSTKDATESETSSSEADADKASETESSETSTKSKTAVTIPIIESVTYTGELQTADISDSEYYTVTENKGGTQPGNYTVILTLKDPENTYWVNSEGTTTQDSSSVELTFVIEEKS